MSACGDSWVGVGVGVRGGERGSEGDVAVKVGAALECRGPRMESEGDVAVGCNLHSGVES